MLRPYISGYRGDRDVHRALRPRARGQARRAEDLSGHAVRSYLPRGSALAGVPAAGVGARPHRPGAEPLPDAVARLDPDLAQPDHAHRVGRPVCVPLPHAHGRGARGAGGGAARREPLGARRRHPSSRHAAVPGRHAVGARPVELGRGETASDGMGSGRSSPCSCCPTSARSSAPRRPRGSRWQSAGSSSGGCLWHGRDGLIDIDRDAALPGRAVPETALPVTAWPGSALNASPATPHSVTPHPR